MKEQDFKHGAIPLNFLHRKIRKLLRKKTIRGMGFDWTKGYDVRDTIGPIAIKNQGSNSSCGGQAGSYFLEIQQKLRGIREGQLSAKSIYAPIAYKGGGTTVHALISRVAAEGALLESSVPSQYVTGEPYSEAMMIEKSWMTNQNELESLKRAGYTPYDIGEDIDDVAATIEIYGAVIWEITGQNNGSWAYADPKPPTGTGGLWNHFMCAIGAKMIDGQKKIIALQSMGTSWGDQGVQYFGEDYFKSGYIVDAFTFIYDTKLVPNSDNHSVWAEIARWFLLQWKRN